MSTRRADTEDAGDDISAVGEKQGRYASRKSEPERRQFLEDDPQSGDVEPHRAFCKGCNEWIDLNPTRKFIMKNWVEHRRHCKIESERAERCAFCLLDILSWEIKRARIVRSRRKS